MSYNLDEIDRIVNETPDYLAPNITAPRLREVLADLRRAHAALEKIERKTRHHAVTLGSPLMDLNQIAKEGLNGPYVPK